MLDNEPLVTEVTARFLQRRGFDALRAHSAGEALGFLEKWEIDVLVMEIFLKDGNGMAFLQIFRKLHPGVPVVVLSQMGYDELVMGKALSAGASAYVSKETEIENLMTAIHRVLSTKAPSTEGAREASRV